MRYTISALDKNGDTTKTWDPDVPEEVADAKATFEKFMGLGYAAFNVTEGGDKGTQIKKFDPNKGSVLLCKPLKGG